MLDREEHVEQAYFFRVLAERGRQSVAAQDALAAIREEILATTKLPLAIDFLASELRHHGGYATAMAKLGHYFTPFQTFVVTEAENDRGRFDMQMALEILAREAEYRSAGAGPQGLFLYEFESLCRNRLGYDKGLSAIAGDSLFDAGWKEWILTVRRQVGLVDFADLLFVRSQHYRDLQLRREEGSSEEDAGAEQTSEVEKPVLFGAKEGRIALANRGRDPLLLFAALHRHLGYPEVPRPVAPDDSPKLATVLLRRVDRLEARLKLMEEEQRGGIDLSKFYTQPGKPPLDDEL